MSAIISVENLSKAYRIGLKEQTSDTFMSAVGNWLKSPLKNLAKLRRLNTFDSDGDAADLIWALKEVCFEVEQGEVVGVIGGNGAGKSTLLKILSRITEPTRGRAVIRGRVSSLLEIGAGFHPELTGRENIYMNGTVLGMTKREIDCKFDEIVDFSGVEKFLDTPIKRYSSGMQVRLAFSVAAHLEPEILIVDEILAVGDAEFQKKSLGKMHAVAKGGRTVLFVSHNMAAIQSLCSTGIELYKGRLMGVGNIDESIAHYRRRSIKDLSVEGGPRNTVYIKKAILLDADYQPTNYVALGGEFHLCMTISAAAKLRSPQIRVGIDSAVGQRMLTIHTPLSRRSIGGLSGVAEIHCRAPLFPLAPGEYLLKLTLSEGRQELETVEDALAFTIVNGDAFGEGRGFYRGVCTAPSQWWKVEVPTGPGRPAPAEQEWQA